MKTRSEDLELLLAVVDSGGFSAASTRLDVPVARISRAVQRLEQRLDVPLLNRTTRSVALTDEGSRFVAEVREGLERLNAAEESLALRRGEPAGRLRVDSASPFVLHQLVPLVGEFRRRYPGIELELSASDDIINLLEQRADVAIRIGALADSTLHARLLGRSRLHLVASPGYLSRAGRPTSVTELEQHQLIGFLAPSSLNRWPVEGMDDEISPSMSTSSGEVMRRLCLAGEGIACLSNFMVGDDIASGQLEVLLPEAMRHGGPREQVQAVYYRNTALSARIQAFLDVIAPGLRL
ncbi:LysR family transcriptional regulator [Halomonas sp. DP8Y7-1]|uniref:LysR family transcriptional regulator n=1 Tax=Halomonas sp. DP8Y7-1 TaxID=2859078 RepID=UPI001C948C76|nr:LysR family transcriptional regulator [Halomonas sp. DP8Y7-1]MBY6027985.1 LysR family transcriptional regulator [Halomonas sp. DP8Y7-1]MED5296290.1 LysR family transcriptional regulator [Pseudomonadota bacterium]